MRRRESRVGANQEYPVHKNNWTSVSIRGRFSGNVDTHPHTPNPFRSVQRRRLPARGPLSFQRMILQGVISVPLQRACDMRSSMVLHAYVSECMMCVSVQKCVSAWLHARAEGIWCLWICLELWFWDFTKMMQQEYIKKVWQLQSMGWIWWYRIYRNFPALKIQSLHKWPLYMKYW